MAGAIQINMRVNAEFHEAIERYRFRREKHVQREMPEFRLTTAEALRMLVLSALKAEEEHIEKPIKI